MRDEWKRWKKFAAIALAARFVANEHWLRGKWRRRWRLCRMDVGDNKTVLSCVIRYTA